MSTQAAVVVSSLFTQSEVEAFTGTRTFVYNQGSLVHTLSVILIPHLFLSARIGLPCRSTLAWPSRLLQHFTHMRAHHFLPIRAAWWPALPRLPLLASQNRPLSPQMGTLDALMRANIKQVQDIRSFYLVEQA